jgi:superfamily II DNA/RNA helicase
MPCWKDEIGLKTIKTIVQECTSFSNGLYSYQLPLVAQILDGDDVLCITATGDGKSALFAIPIVVLREYNINNHLYPRGLPTRVNPIGIIITPTKGLAQSFVSFLPYQ